MTTIDTIDLAGLDGGPVSLATKQLDELDSRVQGRLLRPGDQGWDEAVAIWNGMAARLPALVLQPVSAHEVAAAVGWPASMGCCSASRAGATTSPEPPWLRAA
jgi:hypothetical protein